MSDLVTPRARASTSRSASGRAAGAALVAWAPALLSLLRIVAALLFIMHGTQKLFLLPAGRLSAAVPLWSQAGAAGVIETVGGALLLLGLFTRPVAFVLSGEMAFAYFLSHSPRSVWPILNGGELAVLYCFLFLYFAAAGGGPWSLDALRGRRSGAPVS